MGKGAEEVVVGFRYHMGVQIVGCHGPVDNMSRVIIGEREAWAGNVTTSSTINIDKPDLFGGDDREGGVVGDVDVMMGEAAQGRNAYLAVQQGPKCSAYRGLFSLVFKQFLWSSGNPYFKSPWVEVTRALKGWENDTPWHPEIALIGGKDMNPAHIIYQCFTDSAWGMGYSAADIDDAEWLVAAQKLYDEGFGLSLEWDQQSDIESFVQQILNHINGSVGVNLANGKIRLRLVRDDYNINTLLELNADNILELKSFQRAAYGDSANELVISYTDRDQNTTTIAVQDLASIQAQGAVISSTQQYPGIRDAALATRVGMRDLRVLSSPLAKVVLVTNRVMWDKDKGDVVKLVWPQLGIAGAAFRVIDIDKGTLSGGSITVTMIEDIFGLPANSYASTPVSQWVDTLVPPIAVSSSKVVEASYWDVTRAMRIADQQQLVEGYGFGLFMASRGAVRSTLNYRLTASPDNVTYSDVGTGHFNPTGSLVAALTPIAETLTLTGAYDLDNVTLSVDGGYAYIDDECVAVIAVDPSTGVVSVKRGVLDTVPSAHIAGTRMFFVSGSTGYDRTERVSGETVYYKPLPSTGLGTLASNDAIAKMLVLNNRASRPYPPGNFKVDTLVYPVTVAGPTFNVSWSHRDRSAQTVDFVDYSAGNIGPEIGTTYRLRVYSGATLLRTYDLSGDVTSWSYPSADDAADGNLSTLTITVNSVRDGLESLFAQGHTFQRLAVTGSTGIEGKPATPVLSASAQPFAVSVDWIFGDARTNIEKVEIRVSDDPDFNHSRVLQYVNYPTLTYLHELGTALTYKWYWVRVYDVSGQLSAWSNMVSARSSSSSMTPQAMLEQINGVLSGSASTSKLELTSDNFSIVAPDGSKTPFAVVDIGGGVYKTLLNSDVLIGGNVDIANLKTGSLPNDVMLRLGGGTIELDGAGEIRVFKDLAPNADFVRLSSGEIRFMRYMAGAYQTYNYLSRLETGIANSGDTVVIPGYWKSQPRVMVSPASLALYKAAYAAQDQGITALANALVETSPGSGRWQFSPTATLNLSASSGVTPVNEASGSLTVDTWASATKTTAANCSSVTPSVSFSSSRGNGAGQNFRRSVRWRVEHWNGAAWVAGSYRTVAMGDQFGAVADSAAYAFPSAGTWSWRIYAEAFDTDGSVFGTVSYTTSTEVINGQTGNFAASGSPLTTAMVTRPASTLNPTWEIYELDFSIVGSLTNPFSSSGSNDMYVNFVRPNLTTPANTTMTGWTNQISKLGVANYASSPFALNASLIKGTQALVPTTNAVSATTNGVGSTSSFNLSITTNTMTVKRRTPNTNSTTPANTFNVGSYGWSLASAQVLATGSINWIAVGE